MLGRPGLVAATLFGACGSVDLPDGVIACGEAMSCPAEMRCWSDDRCHSGVQPDGGATDAAPAASDAPAPLADASVRVRIEAEDFADNVQLDAIYDWTEDTGQAGASGSSMAALPDTDGACLDTPPLTCGARLTYPIQLATAGTYHVHLRSFSPNSGDDSVHVGLDDAYLAYVNFPDDASYWRWARVEPALELDTEPHTLVIWMREDGVRLDAIELSDSPIEPD